MSQCGMAATGDDCGMAAILHTREARKVRMIVRMMIGTLFSVGSPRIGHKPRMMLGWCEGGGWMVPGNLG